MNNEQLRAEFEAWMRDNHPGHRLIFVNGYLHKWTQRLWEAYQAGRAAMQSQDKEDAERYRWLRLQRSITDLACVTWNIGHDWVQMDGAELDAAIDHARRVEGEGR